MKKRVNKVLAIFLAVMMVITAVPFASFISSIETKAASSATYYEEYYYPAGTEFVTDLAVSVRDYSRWSGGRQNDCKGYLTDNGWTLLGINCNEGKSADYIHIGYKKSTDESNAIRAIAFLNGDSPDSFDYVINGHTCTFYPVLNSYINSNSLSSSIVDMNRDAGGDYIYMYYTRDPNAGPPITSLDYDENATNNSDSPAQIPAVWLNTGGEKGQAGQAADLNADAGGDYIYVFYGQTGTAVETSYLHSVINTGDSYLANSGRYVSVSALQTAVDNAKAIVADYNSDGLSGTYDQTAIDNAKNAISNELDALQTKVTLNANGGTINGASSTSYNVTIGLASSVNTNVSSYVPVRTGYTFKGWSTSSTAASGTTGEIEVGFNTTLYAVWEANTYKVVFDNLVDFGAWDTSNATNGEISNVTADGFTLTSDADAGEATSGSPFFPVTPGRQYKIEMDFIGNEWDVYIFFCDANGTWIDFADGASNRYSSNGSTGVDPDNAVFTAPDKSEVVKAQIRVDANGSNSSVTFKNIRVYEVGTVEDGVSYINSQTATYDSTYGTLPTPTKEGHTFLGWYMSDGTKLNAGDAVAANDVYVTSKWEINKYTITWIRESGRTTTDTYEYGAKINALAPTASGKNETEHYSYAWDSEIDEFATRDVTYTEIKTSNEHEWVETLYNAPTCTTDGLKVRTCTVCDYPEQTVIPKTGHTYEATVTDPTCTDKGFTTYVCSVCGDTYVSDYVDATGHTELPAVKENEVEPDCENTGSYDAVV